MNISYRTLALNPRTTMVLFVPLKPHFIMGYEGEKNFICSVNAMHILIRVSTTLGQHEQCRRPTARN
uniref:Uncharacterized protein n=1 Tax=Arundo donax TaxID=35708 RepID=A0A0A8ZGH7_ARUDO